ncbi:MAG: prepilin-type N-terminal cleavage/methylation domain-containing protein [Candidatus Thiodiazotropha sp.]
MAEVEQARSKPPQQAGFTLLEILIALLILATIASSAISMLFLNLKGWDRLTEQSDRQVTQQRVMTRMERIISQLTPLSWQSVKGRQLAFIGEPDLLQFIAPAPQPYAAGGLFEYRFSVERDSLQGARVVLTYRPYQPQDSAFTLPDQGVQRVLLSGLGDLQFQYFGTPQGSRQADWNALWPAATRNYPQLIGIQETAADGAIHQRYIALRQWHTGS